MALDLSSNERAEIAALLIDSLDSATEEDIDTAWQAEIKRRIEQVDNGEVELIPAEEVLRSMRERLNG